MLLQEVGLDGKEKRKGKGPTRTDTLYPYSIQSHGHLLYGVPHESLA